MLPALATLIPSLLPVAGNLIGSITGAGGGGGNIISDILGPLLGKGQTPNPQTLAVMRRRAAMGMSPVAPPGYAGAVARMPLAASPPGKSNWGQSTEPTAKKDNTMLFAIGGALVLGFVIMNQKR